jgi:hypothetical protein
MKKLWGFFSLTCLLILLSGCLEKLTMQKIVDRFSDDHIFVASTQRELQDLNKTLEALGCENCQVVSYMDIQGDSHECELLVYQFKTIGEAERFYQFYRDELSEADKVYPLIRRRDQFVMMSNSEEAIKKAIR